MGCTNSKHRDQCPNCRSYYDPVKRSHSMHVHRVLAPTPSSVEFELSHGSYENGDRRDCVGANEDGKNRRREFAVGVNEENIWSSLIEEKIPKVVPKTVISLIEEECPGNPAPNKTPLETPPGEPENIDVWDLMEGLEDNCPLSFPNQIRSFSFNFPPLKNLPLDQTLIHKLRDRQTEAEEESNVVVLYFTSLRGIRKTYENCCDVKSILNNLGFRLDERDVSMHALFKQELRERLGDGAWESPPLPQVFVGGVHIGGVEEIRRLHEEGRLEKALEGCQRVNRHGGACAMCGDARFVPCVTCCGSCKVYYEDDKCGEDEENAGFRRCVDCNENGLRRCSDCCVL